MRLTYYRICVCARARICDVYVLKLRNDLNVNFIIGDKLALMHSGFLLYLLSSMSLLLCLLSLLSLSFCVYSLFYLLPSVFALFSFLLCLLSFSSFRVWLLSSLSFCVCSLLSLSVCGCSLQSLLLYAHRKTNKKHVLSKVLCHQLLSTTVHIEIHIATTTTRESIKYLFTHTLFILNQSTAQ